MLGGRRFGGEAMMLLCEGLRALFKKSSQNKSKKSAERNNTSGKKRWVTLLEWRLGGMNQRSNTLNKILGFSLNASPFPSESARIISKRFRIESSILLCRTFSEENNNATIIWQTHTNPKPQSHIKDEQRIRTKEKEFLPRQYSRFHCFTWSIR